MHSIFYLFLSALHKCWLWQIACDDDDIVHIRIWGVSIKFTNRLTIKYKSPLYQTIENVIYGEANKKIHFLTIRRFFPPFSAIPIQLHRIQSRDLCPTMWKKRTLYAFVSICFDSRTMINWQLLITLSDFYWTIYWTYAKMNAYVFLTASTVEQLLLYFQLGLGGFNYAGLTMWVIARDKCIASKIIEIASHFSDFFLNEDWRAAAELCCQSLQSQSVIAATVEV